MVQYRQWMKMNKKNHKKKTIEEIREGLVELFKVKEVYSIEELRKKLGSNWSTINKVVNQISFIEPVYKQVKCGVRLIKLNPIEEKMLNILLEGAEKE